VPWRDTIEPVRMDRVAVVAPEHALHEALAVVAAAGIVEPDLGVLESAGRAPEAPEAIGVDLVGTAALQHGQVSALAGWAPAAEVDQLASRLGPLGATLVRLRPPAGVQPPTLVPASGPSAAFQPLVDTYTTVPYRDLNPSLFAGVVYVAMFGMMFGDVGHGALLTLGGLLIRSRRLNPAGRLRAAAPFVIGAGLASMGFGFAFGEAFGPTHLVPTLWLSPLNAPTTLLAVAIAVGAALLASSYGLATINRWREGGLTRAAFAVSGLAGAGLYLGLALLGLGWYRHLAALELAGAALSVVCLVFAFAGLLAEAGGRAAAIPQAGVELFDAVVRLGTNTVSFARLAAFGLTHAALSSIVWRGTTVLWHGSGASPLFACILFILGNALAFALEGLIAAIQALRLEYYELFSRVFIDQGRRFRAWHISTPLPEEAPCSPG